jgi:hypothetical protein
MSKVFVMTGDMGMIYGVFSSKEKAMNAIRKIVDFDDDHGYQIYYEDCVVECDIDTFYDEEE